MTDRPGDERRAHSRVEAEEMIGINADDSAQVIGLSVDLSRSGMRLQCVGLELRVGQMVEVSLTVERTTCIVAGRIVRVIDLDGHTLEVGIAFVDLDDDTRLTLERRFGA